MANFKIGQTVVCIKEGSWSGIGVPLPISAPSYGEEVVIVEIYENYLILKGYERHANGTPQLFADRFFRPVQDDFAEKLLANITKQVQREELVLI